MCVYEAVRVIDLLDRVECVSWKKIRMNGRKRKRERRREGNMYVFFVFFVFGFKYRRVTEEEICGWEMPTFLFYSFTET